MYGEIPTLLIIQVLLYLDGHMISGIENYLKTLVMVTSMQLHSVQICKINAILKLQMNYNELNLFYQHLGYVCVCVT